MPHLDVTVTCPTPDSFRVQQVAGMFGLSVGDACQETFAVEVPTLDEPWRMGAIVGPSGSGKTTIARAAFGHHFAPPPRWPRGRAVIDCFGERSIREITWLLSAVGLSSPPVWIKPYHVLSTGERFRCDVARALEDGLPRPSRKTNQTRDGLGRPSSYLSARPAVFCAWGAMFGRRGVARIARLVVLPEYQGVGVGGTVLRACCELISRQGRRATITTSHTAMIAHLRHSPDWRIYAVKPLGGNRCGVARADYRASTGRPVVSAEFVAMPLHLGGSRSFPPS